MAWRLLDHTADVYVEAEGRSLGELIGELAVGMFASMVDVSKVKADKCVEFEVEGENEKDLVINVLEKLLIYKDADLMAFSHVEVDVHGRKARVKACGEKIRRHHEPHGDVKAVSYHNFLLEKREGKYVGRVLLDL